MMVEQLSYHDTPSLCSFAIDYVDVDSTRRTTSSWNQRARPERTNEPATIQMNPILAFILSIFLHLLTLIPLIYLEHTNPGKFLINTHTSTSLSPAMNQKERKKKRANPQWTPPLISSRKRDTQEASSQ